MPYDEGRNSTRARSARIRASHDYEATQLEEMRRRSAAPDVRPARAPLLTRLSAVFLRARGASDAKQPDAIVRAGHVE